MKRSHPRLGWSYLLPLGMVLVLLIGFSLTDWRMTTATGNQAGVDFVSVAVAAELVNQGGGSLYDLAAQRTEQLELSGDPTDAPRPFSNPPFVAQLASTLISGDLEAGFLRLVLINLAAVVALAVIVVRVTPALSAGRRVLLVMGLTASASVGTALAEGAITLIACLGLALLLLGDHEGRVWLQAVGLALASVKPHLVVVPLVVVLAARRGAVVARLAGLGAVVSAWSVATVGVRPWLAYPATLIEAGGSAAPERRFALRWWNLATTLRVLLGPGGEAAVTVLGWVVLVTGVAGLAVLAARTATTGQRCSAPPLAVAAVLGILVLPHANPHDLAWVPLAFALCWAHPNWPTRPRWQRQVLLGTAVLWAPATWVALATAPRGGSVAPVVLLVVFGAVAGRTPAAPPAPGLPGPARHPGEVGVTLR